MSKERGGANAPSIHIEWAPGNVQAVDIAGGRRRSGATISEISSFFKGHKSVLVGIGRQHTFLKAVSLPKAAPEDLRRILSIQLGQHFPLPADQLAFDFIQTNVRADDGFVTILAAVRAADLRQLNSELQAAGVRASRILPVALGAAGVAAHARANVALVVEEAMGGGYTFDMVSDGSVRLSRTVVVDGIDLVREVQRTLAATGAAGEVSLIAAGAADSGSREALARLEDARSEAKTSLELLHEAPPFAFELAEQRELEHRKRIGTQTRISILTLIGAIAVVAVCWDFRSQAAAKVTRAKGQWTVIMNKEKAISSTENKKLQAATDQAKTLTDAFHVAQPLGDVASVIGDSLPKTTWLTGVDLQRGRPTQIRGTTTVPDDVARVLKTLGDSGRFRDVRLVVANSGKISSQPIVQFSITAWPVGNMPMPAPDLKKASAKKPTTTTADGDSKS